MNELEKFSIVSPEQAEAMKKAINAIGDYETAKDVYNGLLDPLAEVNNQRMLAYAVRRRLEREEDRRKCRG